MDNMCRGPYGVLESNPLPAGFHDEECQETVDWDDPQLEKIIRFRLVSDIEFPFWDVSYCMGRLRDGTKVEVRLPFSQLPKRGWKKAVVEHAEKDKVFAKKLGFFNPGVVSALV